MDEDVVFDEVDEETPMTMPAPPMRSNEEVAREVLAGLWGRGRARDAKLLAAGHDPKEIKAEIETIISGS